MQISAILLLLPGLLSLGACTQTVPSEIANDRPTPPPAIGAPTPAPLTIESLAGTYKGVVDEKALKEEAKSWLDDFKKHGITVEQIEHILCQPYEAARITISTDGSFVSGTDDTYELSLEPSNPNGSFVLGTDSINADGSLVFGTDSSLKLEQHGKVKIDGNKLVFTADSIDSTNGSANTPKLNDRCAFTLCTFTLDVAADRKTLLLNESPNSLNILRGYVKQ